MAAENRGQIVHASPVSFTTDGEIPPHPSSVKVTSDEYLTARPNWRSASPGLPAGDFLFSKISAPACPGRQRRRHLIFPNPSTGPGLGYFMEPGGKGSAKSTT